MTDTMLAIERKPGRTEHVDPGQLTPRAAALARIWSAQTLHTRCPVILESVATRRDMGATQAECDLWYGPNGMDSHDRQMMSSWSHWADRIGVVDYLESQAQRIPLGYVPVEASRDTTEPFDDATTTDADLLTRSAALDLLRRAGRPLTVGTFANYNAKPPEGWPGVARYVGRTPLYSAEALRVYARATAG